MTTERSATNERTDMTPPEACAYLREIGEHKIAELIEYICSYVPSENALTECPECNIRFDPQWKEKDAAYRATIKNAAPQAETSKEDGSAVAGQATAVAAPSETTRTPDAKRCPDKACQEHGRCTSPDIEYCRAPIPSALSAERVAI